MKLHVRLPATGGFPRTTVLQGLSHEQAYSMLNAALAVGGEGHVEEDGMQVNMTAYLRNVRIAHKLKRLTVVRS